MDVYCALIADFKDMDGAEYAMWKAGGTEFLLPVIHVDAKEPVAIREKLIEMIDNFLLGCRKQNE
jgi:hypothetical protein